jgi:hypothetical protein
MGMEEPFFAPVIEPFECFYCGCPNQADEHLIGCVINCSKCGRSIVTPQPGQRPLERSLNPQRGQSLAAGLGFSLGGSVFLGVPAAVVAWYAQSRIVGIDSPDAIAATAGAVAVGAVVGATLGWRLSAS